MIVTEERESEIFMICPDTRQYVHILSSVGQCGKKYKTVSVLTVFCQTTGLFS